MVIPLLLRDNRKRQAWEKQTSGVAGVKGRGEEGDEAMLALKWGACCRRRRGDVGG